MPRSAPGGCGLPCHARRARTAAAWARTWRTGPRFWRPDAGSTPPALARLVSAGIDRVRVYRPLRVGLLSTGDELLPPGSDPAAPGIFDTNRPMLHALVEACMATFAIALGLSYAVTIVSQLDVDGRYVVLTAPAIGIGVMIAPAVAGLLSQEGGYRGVFAGAALAVLAAAICSLFSLRRGLPLIRNLVQVSRR